MNTASNRTKLMARRCTVAVLSLGCVALVAACGSSGIGSSSTSTPAASASATGSGPSGSVTYSAISCAQIKALRSTLTDISNTSVNPASAPRIASDLAKADQELNALKSQAGPLATQANQVSNALNAIKTDGANLTRDPSPTNLIKLTSAVNSFKSTAQPLIQEMQTACP